MSSIAGAALRVGRTDDGLLPAGRLLTPEVWACRYQGPWCCSGSTSPGVAIFAVIRGLGVVHGLPEASLVAGFVLLPTHAEATSPTPEDWARSLGVLEPRPPLPGPPVG